MTTKNEKFQVINQLEHNDLRVKPPINFTHLKNTSNAIIFAEEVVDVVGDAPVVFLKDAETGSFKLSVLYGLAADENVFVDEQGKWLASYIPAALNINPFGVFLDNDQEQRVQIDVNSACLSKTEGHQLFDGDKESAFLVDMRQQLDAIIDASIQTDNFIAELVNRNLLTEFKIELEGLTEANKDDDNQIIADLYTINVDELSYMSHEDIIKFHEMHYWGAVYAIQQSLKQFRRLAQLRNELQPNNKVKLAIHVDRDAE